MGHEVLDAQRSCTPGAAPRCRSAEASEAARHALDDLRGAVHRAVHGGDGAVVDALHVAEKVGRLHDLARRLHVHRDDALAAQVEAVAAILLPGVMGAGNGRRWRGGGGAVGAGAQLPQDTQPGRAVQALRPCPRPRPPAGAWA